MSVELSGKPDAWKLARPVWGWGRGGTPRPTPPTASLPPTPSPVQRAANAEREARWDEVKALNGLLAGLAKQQSLDPLDYLSYRVGGENAAMGCETRLRTLRADGTDYILAVQSFDAFCNPGMLAGCPSYC